MREVTLKVADKQFSFFMELVKQLGIEVAENVSIPEEHKAIVRDRIRSSIPEELIPWDEARKQLILKTKK
jgi:hypothetical protein